MTMKPASLDIDPLDRALAILTDNAEEAPKLHELAASVGLSASHLQRMFRKRFGVSPAEFVQSQKLKQLKSALRENDRVTDAIYDAGYGSGSRVYEKTGQLLGMTPASYRRGAAGIVIRYTTLDTLLGHLLVAATDRGICSVILGKNETEIVADLRNEFPQATIERTDAGDDWIANIIARITAEIGRASCRERV